MRTELKIGLLAMGASLTLNCIFPLPELVTGFFLGLAICFELVGALPETAYQKIKATKRRWLRH